MAYHEFTITEPTVLQTANLQTTALQVLGLDGAWHAYNPGDGVVYVGGSVTHTDIEDIGDFRFALSGACPDEPVIDTSPMVCCGASTGGEPAQDIEFVERIYQDNCEIVKLQIKMVNGQISEGYVLSGSENHSPGDILTPAEIALLTPSSPDTERTIHNALTLTSDFTLPAGFVSVAIENTSDTLDIYVLDAVVVPGQSIFFDGGEIAYRSDLVIDIPAGGSAQLQWESLLKVPCASDDQFNNLHSGETTTVDSKPNDTLCDNYTNATWVESNLVNCTVVNNNDGTFDVTPTIAACGGSWSFDYTLTCESGAVGKATISGNIDDTQKSVALHLNNTTTVSFEIFLSAVGTYDVDWGDGNVEVGLPGDDTEVTHVYSSPYTGDVIITYSGCEVVRRFFSDTGGWDFDVQDIPDEFGTITFHVAGQNTLSGDIANVPPTVGTSTFYVWGQNTLSGDIANVPPTVGTTTFLAAGQNTLSGDIANVPPTVGTTTFYVWGQNTINGDVSNIPPTVGTKTFYVLGQSTINGDIANVPPTVGTSGFNVRGQNTINGDIANVPPTVGTSTFNVWGQNTINGDIANVPPTVGTSGFYVLGQNTINGDIANVPPTVGTSAFHVTGQNTLSGDIANVPPTVGTSIFYVTGQNTLSGDVSNIPPTVGTKTFYITGQNTLSGDTANIPPTVGTKTFFILGNCTITGSLATVPPTVGTVTLEVCGLT